MTLSSYEYNYTDSSAFIEENSEKKFLLSHCTEIEEDQKIPCFFYGKFIDSFIISRCLSVLARTVKSHFSIRPEQRAAMRDPIVSVGSGEIRFEGFSSCAGVYARVDVRKDAVDGEFLASGCTNVDFNDPIIRAFNMVNRSETMILGVGHDHLKITTPAGSVTEKKVSLPDKWIRGLGNVQYYLSQMESAFQMTRIQAVELFKALPAGAVKSDYFLTENTNGYFLSPIEKENSVRLGGVHRLNLIRTLLPFIESVSVYRDPEEQCSAFNLHFKDVNMLFVFSAGIYRGFSGEGKNLENLTEEIPEEWIIGISSLFRTNETFNPKELVLENSLSQEMMINALASLYSIGLLGFDLDSRKHYYRRLPFKLSRLLSFNPRLVKAKKAVERDEVRILNRTEHLIEAEVKGSGDVVHRVLIQNNKPRCTCKWYTDHETSRGLCRHILSVRMHLSQQSDSYTASESSL
ncbi:MAG TPA: hypothetical protein PK453_03485 [Leptospiraceae bacterium]|nr:hypothetical protein [Leptospiraceae bacterium]